MNEWSAKWCELHFSEAVELYRADHEFCALCGITQDAAWHQRYPGRLEAAHIFAGNGRRKCHPAAIVMLCSRDHRHSHGQIESDNGVRMPPITQGMLLWCKQELGQLDLDVLSKISGYQPGYIEGLIEPIGDFYMNQRRASR